jgi:two-component system LytT family sensor kinase
MLEPGTVRICGHRDADKFIISIEDNAGAFCAKLGASGLGMNIVDKRIKNYFGSQYGTEVSCVPNKLTKVSVVIPFEKGHSSCSGH